MSRSYKHQPFQAICGTSSAKHDKQLAARGVRRRFRHVIKNTRDFENFLAPHRYECSHNETYSWNRDGKQTYQGLDARDWFRYCVANNPDHDEHWLWGDDHYRVWPPFWYRDMMRK